MREVEIAGVGMTNFGKLEAGSLKTLASSAVREALDDAGLTPASVAAVFFGNAVAGLITGQEMIRGQVALRETGLLGLPIVNVENACASGSTAAHLACLAVASGWVDVALAVGAEQMTHPDRSRTFEAIASAIDLERKDELLASVYGEDDSPDGRQAPRSVFMDIYARETARYMQATGATELDFARVAVKNRGHGSLNPRAQYRNPVTEAEVLASRKISGALTLLMCCPTADGAAAVVFRAAGRGGGRATRVRVRSSVLLSGGDGGKSAVSRAAAQAYEAAGIGPQDLSVVELHDAAAPAELMLYEELSLCRTGDGPAFVSSGRSSLTGSLPVNTSGGLLSRGHPVGATGCAQLCELTYQLRGAAGDRQVANANVALAQNGGGYLSDGAAATTVTILSR